MYYNLFGDTECEIQCNVELNKMGARVKEDNSTICCFFFFLSFFLQFLLLRKYTFSVEVVNQYVR